MVTKQFKLETGLHVGATSKLIHKTNDYMSDFWIKWRGKEVNGKSIMGILSLAVPKHDVIEITVQGKDEAEAIDALSHFFEHEKLAQQA